MPELRWKSNFKARRSELSGRRVLAVLDNALGPDQIRPLLPGASRTLVLITSRRRLTDLDGADALSWPVRRSGSRPPRTWSTGPGVPADRSVTPGLGSLPENHVVTCENRT